MPQAPTERSVFSDTAQKGRRSTPLYTDTIVTLIGKPLPAKKDVFFTVTQKRPCCEKSGWERTEKVLGFIFHPDTPQSQGCRL